MSSELYEALDADGENDFGEEEDGDDDESPMSGPAEHENDNEEEESEEEQDEHVTHDEAGEAQPMDPAGESADAKKKKKKSALRREAMAL